MKDRFSSHAPGLTAPLDEGFEVTPDDAVDLPEVTRAVFLGQGGDLAVQFPSGNEVVFRNIKSGVLYPLRLSRILATGTTASDLLGLV